MKNRSIVALGLTTFESKDLTNDYKPVIHAGFSRPCSIFRLNNNSKKDILISYDGVNDDDFLEAGGVLELTPESAGRPCFKEGALVYIKKVKKSDAIYLSSYYKSDG